MLNNDLGVTHTENTLNVLETFPATTVAIMRTRMGMWGEAMFGTVNIWGAFYENTYNKGDHNVLCSRESYNIVES